MIPQFEIRESDVRRGSFITLLVGIASWPLAARAQPAPKLPTIGFLGPSTSSLDSQRVGAFLYNACANSAGLRAAMLRLGIAGQTRRVEHLGEFAAEFVRLRLDVIVTSGTPPVLAAKQAMSVIPIVFAAVGDPIGNGLVASLARPGGNVTGSSIQATDLAGKRVGLLREVVPRLHSLVIMANRGAQGPRGGTLCLQ
jgi:ABC transporter substrate binding protein